MLLQAVRALDAAALQRHLGRAAAREPDVPLLRRDDVEGAHVRRSLRCEYAHCDEPAHWLHLGPGSDMRVCESHAREALIFTHDEVTDLEGDAVELDEDHEIRRAS